MIHIFFLFVIVSLGFIFRPHPGMLAVVESPFSDGMTLLDYFTNSTVVISITANLGTSCISVRDPPPTLGYGLGLSLYLDVMRPSPDFAPYQLATSTSGLSPTPDLYELLGYFPADTFS